MGHGYVLRVNPIELSDGLYVGKVEIGERIIKRMEPSRILAAHNIHPRIGHD